MSAGYNKDWGKNGCSTFKKYVATLCTMTVCIQNRLHEDIYSMSVIMKTQPSIMPHCFCVSGSFGC